jgi:hypothetical protein
MRCIITRYDDSPKSMISRLKNKKDMKYCIVRWKKGSDQRRCLGTGQCQCATVVFISSGPLGNVKRVLFASDCVDRGSKLMPVECK